MTRSPSSDLAPSAAFIAALMVALPLGIAPAAAGPGDQSLTLAQTDSAPAAQGQTAQDQTAPDPAKPSLKPLPTNTTTAILGKKVKGPQGEDLGLIVDVVVDALGHPRAAVIDFGGFLGVGSRKIAVDWQALNFLPGNPAGRIELSLDRTAIQAAPEYKPDAPDAAMAGVPPASPPRPEHDK
jgi:hypothetical protein